MYVSFSPSQGAPEEWSYVTGSLENKSVLPALKNAVPCPTEPTSHQAGMGFSHIQMTFDKEMNI